MLVASWNVNSVRQRQELVLAWLQARQPDLLMLQEIKCEDAAFPREAFAAVGYRSVVIGQKGYNGVAALSREPLVVRQRRLPSLQIPDDAEPEARYLECGLGRLVVGNLYLPNGNSRGAEGFAGKLAWMAALVTQAEALLRDEPEFMLVGDFNVCPTDEDFAPGTLPPDDALVHPEVRRLHRTLQWLGLTDAVRATTPRDRVYTFWDYQKGCWQADRGLRIDHAMLSPVVAERLVSALPDRMERDKPQPSDHVPLMVTLG